MSCIMLSTVLDILGVSVVPTYTILEILDIEVSIIPRILETLEIHVLLVFTNFYKKDVQRKMMQNGSGFLSRSLR